MESVFLFVILFASGTILLYLGISGVLGYRRRSYILWYHYGYVSGGINYSSIPLGVMFLIWAVTFTIPFPDSLAWVLLFTSGGIGFIGVLLGMLQPKFLMPEWYRWLKTNHKDIMPWLREDVERMGYDAWREQTDTQEGLEAWVAEVRQKHKLDEVDQRFIGDPHA